MTEGPPPEGSIILAAEGRRSTLDIVPEGLAARLRALTGPRRGLILMDRALQPEAERWRAELSGFPVVFPQGQGEAAKTWEEAGRLLAILAQEKLARDDWFIARGGGALTDLGAFAAGLYRRGMRLILAPTTLLGAVDAAVGGKTAVNLAGAKNQAGHFYLADHVLADLAAFRSLSRAQLAEGLVEAYKTGLAADPGLAELVEARAENLPGGDPALLAEVVRRSMAAKAALVARDFREERGLREVLNLGHTYGHALESHYAPRLSHGLAVAVGLAVAARLSAARRMMAGREAERIIGTVRRLTAPGPWPEPPPEDRILALLLADKKIRNGRLRVVALEGAGRPRILEITPEALIEAARNFQADRD